MRLLLDTHAYAWWVTDDRKLTGRVRSLLIAADTEVLISAVVPWELATKFRIGKWPGADTILADLDLALIEDRLTPLPITLAHARRAGLLSSRHKDPFDRVLAAQAEIEAVPIVTADPAISAMGVEVVW